MQENLIKAYSDQAIKQYQSLIQLNSLLLTNLEKGVEFQLHTINNYSHITDTFNKSLLKDSKRSTLYPQEFVSDTDYIWQILA